MVKPHFTIVFPTDKITGLDLLKHIESIDLHTDSFNFTLDKAMVVEDIHSRYYQIQLVSDKPISEMIKIHDRLYSGLLDKELRKDSLYTPHITIAGSDDATTVKELARNIHKEGLDISGKINKITLSSFDGERVSNIRDFRLN